MFAFRMKGRERESISLEMLTFAMNADLRPAYHFQNLEARVSGVYTDLGESGLTSSKVPNPPGSPMKAHERFAISAFLSCIEFTTT